MAFMKVPAHVPAAARETTWHVRSVRACCLWQWLRGCLLHLRLRFPPRLPHSCLPAGAHRAGRSGISASDTTSTKQFPMTTGHISSTPFYLSPASPTFPLTTCLIFIPLLFLFSKYLPLPLYVWGFPLVLKHFPVWKCRSLLTITGPSFKQESKISPSLTEEPSSCICPDFGDIYIVKTLPLAFAVRIPGW